MEYVFKGTQTPFYSELAREGATKRYYAMSIYKGYTQEELDAVKSQFLIDSWSYSKVSTFARNEKAFEMNYIFGQFGKRSATTIACLAALTVLVG